MRTRTRIIVAMLAGLAAGILPALAVGGGGSTIEVSFSLKAFALFYAAGLVTALTPCVYPLIPITVSIFGAGKAARSKGRAAVLSATYVLGIAVMYSTLGVIAAATGKAFGTYLGNPIVAGVFAVAMLAMAASMFGAFELALPMSVQQKLSGVAGFGFGSAFMMGLVCGIVAAPCTGPALFGALTQVGKSGQLALGFAALFSYGVGLGTPFFILGTFAVKLPKSGAWMEAVKSVLGILLVIVAISFVKPFLPAPVASPTPINDLFLGVAVGVVVFIAISLGTLDLSFHGHAREWAGKALGLVAIIGALAFRFGWIVDASAHPVEPSGTLAHADAPKSPFIGPDGKLIWLGDEQTALAKSKELNRPIIIDFSAKWCAACMELEKHTFSAPKVRDYIAAKFVPMRVDGTESTPVIDAIQEKYGVAGLPVVTIVDTTGHQLETPKVVGYLEPDAFLAEIQKAKL